MWARPCAKKSQWRFSIWLSNFMPVLCFFLHSNRAPFLWGQLGHSISAMRLIRRNEAFYFELPFHPQYVSTHLLSVYLRGTVQLSMASTFLCGSLWSGFGGSWRPRAVLAHHRWAGRSEFWGWSRGRCLPLGWSLFHRHRLVRRSNNSALKVGSRSRLLFSWRWSGNLTSWQVLSDLRLGYEVTLLSLIGWIILG